MKKRFIVTNLLSTMLIATSCGTTYPAFVKINRYENYDDCNVDFNKCVEYNFKEKIIKYSPKLFNLQKDKKFNDFGFSYYIRGVCECNKDHDNHYINCSDIHGGVVWLFLTNPTTDILITVPSETEITNYTNIEYAKSFLEDSSSYDGYRYLKECVFKNKLNALDYQELYKFQYTKEEEMQLYERFFVLTSNNIPFESIIFSKGTSMENVNKYKEAIKNFIINDI